MELNRWLFEQSHYLPEENAFYETIFALANGYIGVRSTLEFDSLGGRPGAFGCDVYDYGLSVPNQIVNLPNWLDLKIIINDAEINLDYVDIIEFYRALNAKNGILKTKLKFADSKHRITELRRYDILHAIRRNLYLTYGLITPINYSGRIAIESCTNYQRGNSYHGGYAGSHVKSFHWELIDSEVKNNHSYLTFQTSRTRKIMAIYSSLIADCGPEFNNLYEYNRVGIKCSFPAVVNNSYEFIKINTVVSGDHPVDVQSKITALHLEHVSTGYESLKNEHILEWARKWDSISLSIDGDSKVQKGLIFATYQLLQAGNFNDFGMNIPARGLTSEYHNGHFFFNTELYMIPFYSWFKPELAKSLLYYRINSKAIAAQNAADMGCGGVYWTEESDLAGKPAGPTVVNNFVSGEKFEEWTGRLVKHIPANVAYAIKTYTDITGDIDFEGRDGLEMIVEIARFYISLVTWNDVIQKYEIKHVIGPDEYHIGVDNDFYTNEMARWAIGYALETVAKYRELTLNRVSESELIHWQKVYHCIKKPVQDETGILEQFDGYFQLPDIKIDAFRKNGLPLITPNIEKDVFQFANLATKMVKQCDVLMFLSMFLKAVDGGQQKANFDFYDCRTMHESSLSATHSGILAARIGETELAYKYLLISARFNLDYDPPRNYNNGLHLAAFAGSWLILLNGFLGIDAEDQILAIRPRLPREIASIGFQLNYRGNIIHLKLSHNQLRLRLVESPENRLNIRVNDQIWLLTTNAENIIEIQETMER
jgi:kojibiose phosphorylase